MTEQIQIDKQNEIQQHNNTLTKLCVNLINNGSPIILILAAIMASMMRVFNKQNITTENVIGVIVFGLVGLSLLYLLGLYIYNELTRFGKHQKGLQGKIKVILAYTLFVYSSMIFFIVTLVSYNGISS